MKKIKIAKADVGYGLEFDDKVMLSILLDHSESLDHQRMNNPGRLAKDIACAGHMPLIPEHAASYLCRI